MKDITLRAIDTLKEVDLILAEDTRQTKKLLMNYEISNSLEAFHQHNEHKRLESVIEKLKSGISIALVSDAGTPGISDPGFLLVRACLEEQIKVECLPGATALIPALVKSGFPSDKFVFEGFLPHKKGRQKRITQIAEEQRTTILYESPHRLVKTLKQLQEILGSERNVSVSRELTKVYEETINGTLEELISFFENRAIKGEIVIVIQGKV